MRTLMNWLVVGLIMAMAIPSQVNAQDAPPRPEFVIMQTNHFNFDNEDGTREDWLALEQEYHEKVIMKNDYIVGAQTLVHYYTNDNSELIRVWTAMSWEDIENAVERIGELEAEAWPDEGERNAFLDKLNAYFTGVHSDEIYRTRGSAKLMSDSEPPSEAMVIYIQKSQSTWPEDGSEDEIMALNAEYSQAVIHKNDLVKGYYPMRHGWGANSGEIVDVFVYESLADLQAAAAKTDELIEAQWADEASRNKFFDRYNAYFTGWHADYLYRTVPGLAK